MARGGRRHGGTRWIQRRLKASVRAIKRVWLAALLLPAAILIAQPHFASFWNRPQLRIFLAKGLAATQRVVVDGAVSEYRVVMDLQTSCVVAMMESTGSEDFLPEPLQIRSPRIVYGLYLQNVGRSEIRDLKFTFTAGQGEFTVASSPQLTIRYAVDNDPPRGLTMTVVTIESLPANGTGVVTATLPILDSGFTVQALGEDKWNIEYPPGMSAANDHVHFVGSPLTSQTPITNMGVLQLFKHRARLFGLDAISLPVDALDLSAKGGSGSTRPIVLPGWSCPSDTNESFTFDVSQRAAPGFQDE